MIGIKPDCIGCKHYDYMASIIACKAFPKGIPEEIINGKKHLKPTKEQKNKIVYEKLVINKIV